VETAEKYADSGISDATLTQQIALAERLYHASPDELAKRAISAAWGTLDTVAAQAAFEIVQTAIGAVPDAVQRKIIEPTDLGLVVCNSLRDIFGNPWGRRRQPIPWMSSTVESLAHAIYEEYAFCNMPILADALEDAGCDNAEILNHCREPKDHVRGCWVLDLTLGKD
jgi:hypothetical protein